MSELIIPDSIEPIIGRRAWGLARNDGRIRLCSARGTVWPEDEALEAACPQAHTSPDEDCTCGIYALNESQPWPYYDFTGPGYAVWGEVLLWGKVVEGGKGYRAQYAYAKRLYLAHKDYRYVVPLRESYKGVPVMLRNPYPEVARGHR